MIIIAGKQQHTATKCMLIVAFTALLLLLCVTGTSSFLNHNLQQQRNLDIGDFDQFNDVLLKDLQILLPDTTVSDDSGLTLNVQNLVCTNIIIGDIQTNSTIGQQQQQQNTTSTTIQDVLSITLSAYPISITCSADYTFDVFFITGKGRFTATSETTSVETRMNIYSKETFEYGPPMTANMEYCNTIINTNGQITFDGATYEPLLNLFKQLISDIVDQYASEAVCDLLSDSSTDTMFNKLLNQTATQLDIWILQAQNDTLNNPLYVEEMYIPPKDVTLINFHKQVLNNSTKDNNTSSIVSTSISDLMVHLLQNVDTLFSTEVHDENGELGINTFIRNQLYNNEESDGLNIDIATLLPNFNPLLFESIDNKFLQTSIYIKDIHMIGLDTIQTLEPFVSIGAYTLQNTIQWKNLIVDVSFTMDIQPSTQPNSILIYPDDTATTNTNIVEDFTIRLNLTDITVDLALFMAINQMKFENISLGSLLSTNTILPCFLSTMEQMEVSGFNVSILDIGTPTLLDGFISPGLDRMISQLTEALYMTYQPTFIRAIPGIFQGPIRTMISKFFNTPANQKCTSVLEDEGMTNDDRFVDFRDLLLPPNDSVALGGTGTSQYGNLIRSVLPFLSDEFFSTDLETGTSLLNTKFIADFTEKQSGTPGTLYYPDDLVNTDQRIQAGGLDANIRLRAYGAYLNNLDTLAVPILLQPVMDEPTYLNNSIEFGSNRSVQLGMRVLFGLTNEDSDIENELEISLDMKSLEILLTALVSISEKALTTFPIKDILNLQCWLATIPAPALDSQGVRINEDDKFLSVVDMIATVSELALNITCVNCSSPRMVELTQLLSSTKGSNAVTDLANEIFGIVPTLFEGNFLQLAIDRALNDAKMQCPHSPLYDPNYVAVKYDAFQVAASETSTSFFLGLLIVCGVLTTIVLFVVITTKFVVRRRHHKWINSISKKQVMMLWNQQEKEQTTKDYINESTDSMFQSSQAIPAWIRWTMPVIILGNIGFFLSGHLSLAASVTIIGSLGGQTFSEEGFFEFSMAKSTIEIWNAGGQELAILIFMFSFAWPYTKTLLTLALWFVPPTTLSVERRGSILLWLDFLAKWSTIDIFVLIVTIVSFRVSIQSPEIEFLPSDFYSLDLLVAPKWGLYANLTAQILSQLSSHYIIHYHRRIVETARNENGDSSEIVQKGNIIVDADDNEMEVGMSLSGDTQPMDNVFIDDSKSRLCTHAFKRPHRGDTDKLVTRRIVSPLLVLLTVCCVGLVILGFIFPSYSVNALGVVGVLVESGQNFQSADTSYSVFSTISLLFKQATLTGTAADFIGLGSLSFIMLLSVLLVPVVQALVLLVQWFAPITNKRRHRLMIVLEILQAWQYAEVYLLAILVGSWQLGPISEFMINPYCDSLKGFFSEMVYYGILKDEDAQCFRTDMKVEPTFYLLFVGAIILTLINSFVMKAVTQYFRDVSSPLLSTMDVRSKLSNNDIEDASCNETISESDASEITEKIHQVPVLFSDRYRWFLQREDSSTCSRQSSRASTLN